MRVNRTTVEVDDVKYDWWISREPQWCHEDGWQGVQITVELTKKPKKQLLIQLLFSIESRRSTPHRQRPKVPNKNIILHIKDAINLGWQPESKGKPFRYDA